MSSKSIHVVCLCGEERQVCVSFSRLCVINECGHHDMQAIGLRTTGSKTRVWFYGHRHL